MTLMTEVVGMERQNGSIKHISRICEDSIQDNLADLFEFWLKALE